MYKVTVNLEEMARMVATMVAIGVGGVEHREEVLEGAHLIGVLLHQTRKKVYCF